MNASLPKACPFLFELEVCEIVIPQQLFALFNPPIFQIHESTPPPLLSYCHSCYKKKQQNIIKSWMHIMDMQSGAFKQKVCLNLVKVIKQRPPC
ncbi:Hypothetical predicted protein [Podarcis lilfordi]|uniref:Uncharacterized protein n=1 Tax=Podarcis lilfordi TaxID=74358 RepID=A0AA35KVR0_9SAUR|nr:Hypothetical predicted protein [Podarcis lilfordi]